MGHEKLPTLRRQLRDRHPRKDRVVVEQHPQEDHLERLRHPRGGEHHEPVAEPAETFGLESGRVALGRHEVEPGRELRRQRARVVAPVKQLRHRGPPREVGAEIANQWRGGNHGRESTPGRDNPGPHAGQRLAGGLTLYETPVHYYGREAGADCFDSSVSANWVFA